MDLGGALKVYKRSQNFWEGLDTNSELYWD